MTIANALGWTLLHAIWEGALISLLLAAALCFVRSPRLRYVAACVALAATLGCFAVTLARLMPADSSVVRLVPVLSPASPADTGRFAFTLSEPQGITLPPWIAPLWMIGVVLFQLRALGGWVAVRRFRRTGVCVAARHWQARVNELATRLHIARPVALLQSSLAEVPVVTGHLRPVILMPLGVLTGLPCAQVETILMHELAHIRRHDYLINLVQTFAEGLLFYHPAVWWISNLIRKERENCCDDLVVATSGGAHQYAIALAALAESRWDRQEIAMAATGGNLGKRIRRLLNQPEGPRAGLAPVFGASLIVIVFAAVMAAYQADQTKLQPAGVISAAEQTEQAPETAYTKWLKEDVAYIITDAERTAFKKLVTDQEREHFIEQFWELRDPTPGTVENEFKEEHYRRIRYVNDHYSAAAAFPGWKTDRGRIYIKYGPADEIESHPSGGKYTRPAEEGGGVTTTYPFEQWRYKFIDGIGTNVVIEFVDSTGTGRYEMTRDPKQKEKDMA
jgi:GWxTD domain-containing protein